MSRSRARTASAAGAVGLLVAGLAFSLTTAPASADDHLLEPGETAGTSNFPLLSNTPIPAELGGEGSINSDIAFQGDKAFVGNFNGFSVYDISNPRNPSVVATVFCPGGQSDITVYGDLAFTSVDAPRSDDTCGSTSASAASPTSWEGMRIWDISDVTNPQYVGAVRTDCGSHTHTLVPGGDDNVYIYVSSYGPRSNFPNCQPPHDKISIIDVPLDDPGAAAVVATPVLFPDGGYTNTAGCHDITAYPELDIAAGACMGNGILMDISDPVNPVVTSNVTDTENFAFWHSATFNNAGTKVVFTDELGGGVGAVCNSQVRDNQGANGIYDIVDGELEFRSYYKIPREQGPTENCVAHNGTLVPVNGRDVMVQSWYQGGLSVFDFTDSENPVEIAWFDRGPIVTSTGQGTLGGSWSSAYYNGYVYSSEIWRGFDVFDLKEPSLRNAKGKKMKEFNGQTQPSYKEAPGKRR